MSGFRWRKSPILVDLSRPFGIDLIPNDEAPETTLYFGLMDFVTELPAKKWARTKNADHAAKKLKCVVWDLDNTLWDGVLVEDGPDRLRLETRHRRDHPPTG